MSDAILIRHEWAHYVADNVRQYTPEPAPPVRGYRAAKERARHANASRWQSLCWAYRVLRTVDGERANAIKRHCITIWNRPPQNKWDARETAHGLR